jgi:hypothetical protein
MSEFEREVLECLRLGIRWRLEGEPCWCTCERLTAWKRGNKLHGEHCLKASALFSLLRVKEREAYLGLHG